MPDEWAKMMEINRKLDDQSTKLTRVEDTLKHQDEALDTMLKIVRGDGNGDRGLMWRVNSLRHKLAEVFGIINELRAWQKSHDKSCPRSATDRTRWKTIGIVAAAIAQAIATAAALVLAAKK